MHTSKPKDTNGASGAPSPEATGSVSGEKKRAARLNAENALLARIIIDGGGELLDVAERRGLTPADFGFPITAAIFNAIQKLRRAEKSIDARAVCEELIRAGVDRGWARFNTAIVLSKKTRRSAALRALDAIKPPHLPPTIEAQTAALAEIIEADDRALRFAAELRDARAAEAKAREELEQLRARVKAAEADAAEARREERAARNEAASETRTLRAVCARLAAAEKEIEERRRVEAVQARCAEALTAENARLTAELSRLMAFVPEEALTDRHPTTTEKIER